MAQKIKGINIQLNADTSGIDKAIKDVNKSLYNTEDELKKVDKLLKHDPKDITILTQKQSLLTSAIKDTKEKLEQLNKAKELADNDKGVDKNTNGYRDLERQIKETTVKLKDFESQTIDVDNALKNTSNDTNRFGDVLKANLTSEAIIGGIKAFGNAIKQMASKFVGLIRDTAKYSDDVNTLSKQYNLSTKQIQQYIKASELIDVDINTIANSMSKLTRSMSSTSGGVIDAFNKLGVETKNTDGTLRDSNEVFNETISALGNIANETEQDAVAMQIFGKSASDLGPLINGGAEQLKEFNKYLEENNLLLSQEQLDKLNSLEDSFNELSVVFDSLEQQVGVELAPIIEPLIKDLSKFLIDHREDIINVANKVGEIATEIIEDLEPTIKELDDLFIEPLGENIVGIYSNLTFIFSLFDDKNTTSIIAFIKKVNTEAQLLSTTLGLIADTMAFIFSKRVGDEEHSGWGWWNKTSSGGYGSIQSGGYGALQSGGFNKNSISMTNSFVVNGNLDEAQAKKFVEYVGDQINEYLGNQI